MIDKEELTKHIKNSEDRQLVMRSLDKAEATLKNFVLRSTDFYDPYQIMLCEGVFSRIPNLKYFTEGGYDQAERQILIIYPEYMKKEELNYPIGAIKIYGKFNKEEVTHRDFLGAILGLGLKREKIGDIIVADGQANVIGYKDICEYIRMNLDKVGRYKINVENCTFDELIKNQEEYKCIAATVPSLRLDAILAVAFGESRSAIVKLINKDRIKVNWKAVSEVSYPVNEGDVISFKGKGRIILEEIGNKTKKDRYKVVLKRLI